MDNNLFKNIEKKTGVNMKDLMDLAGSLQHANFKDEKTVRDIVDRVSQMANKQVTKEKKDKIVKAITNNGDSIDFGTIAKMLNNK